MSSTSQPSQVQRLLITGATGLVGSHLAEATLTQGLPTVLLARDPAKLDWLKSRGAQIVRGELNDPDSLQQACLGVTHVVHCAAKVGDWGPCADYLQTNLTGLQHLIAALDTNSFQRFVHLSSLGVYPSGHHHQSDERLPMASNGLDSYTHSKIKAEACLQELILSRKFPAVILRPGFIYGQRDQTVLPRLIASLEAGRVRYLGHPEHKVNNTYVGNLVDSILLALEHPRALGETFNITDPRLVSKREFLETICQELSLIPPTKTVPYALAKRLAAILEAAYRMLGKSHPPLLSQARVKFLGANLDFSIAKAQSVLGFTPQVDFTTAIRSVLRHESPSHPESRQAA